MEKAAKIAHLEDAPIPASPGYLSYYSGSGRGSLLRRPAKKRAQGDAQKLPIGILGLRHHAALASCLLVLFLMGGPALAAPGALDPTFGTGGKVTIDFFGVNTDQGQDVAVQSDGKLVVAGFAQNGSTPTKDFALARYNTNGTLDTTFDADGRVITDFFGMDELSNDDMANGVAVQPDGKIVAAGYGYDSSGTTAFAVARYAGATQTSTDTTAPRVTAMKPVGTGVKRNTPLTATFSEAMKTTTIGKSSFRLYKVASTGTTQITNVTVRLSSNGLTATLDPFGTSATLLTKNTKYKAVVTTGAQDLADNALDQAPTKAGDQPASWTFTTGTR